MSFGFRWIDLRLCTQSSALLFAVSIKILEILFGGLRKRENCSIRLESILMRYLKQVDVHAVALFMSNWIDYLAVLLRRMRRRPFRGSTSL